MYQDNHDNEGYGANPVQYYIHFLPPSLANAELEGPSLVTAWIQNFHFDCLPPNLCLERGFNFNRLCLPHGLLFCNLLLTFWCGCLLKVYIVEWLTYIGHFEVKNHKYSHSSLSKWLPPVPTTALSLARIPGKSYFVQLINSFLSQCTCRRVLVEFLLLCTLMVNPSP